MFPFQIICHSTESSRGGGMPGGASGKLAFQLRSGMMRLIVKVERWQESIEPTLCDKPTQMNTAVVKVLLVEDVPKDARVMREMLQEDRANSFELEWVDSVDLAIERLQEIQPAVLLLDLALAASHGSKTMPELQHAAPHLPIIILSSLDDEQSALKAVHQGAQDYLVKGEINAHLLVRSVRYAIERKRSEMALLSAEEKYRSIFENTVEGIFQTSPEGQYLSANSALARIYGYDSPEALAESLTNISRDLYVEPGRRAEFVALMEKHDVVSGFESQIYRKDRSVIWISENVRAVRDRRGNLLYYEGTVEDITDRRQHEEDLRNSEALYHSLVETLPQNIFRKNLNEQFTFANSRFCQTLGRPLSEIVGKTDFDFYPYELAAKYQKDDQLIVETGKPLEATEENQPPGSEKLYVNVVKTPLYDAQGRIIGLQGIFWDITEKRRAEEALKQANLDLALNREQLRLKNDQMEEDLRMAREIQQAIIPQQYPSFPQHASPDQSVLSFCHRYLPTGVVGGDFFNVRPLSDTRAGVFICDVMGHGVRSALVTAIVRALVEELTPDATDPGELLAHINQDLRSILKQSGTPLFTTAFYMIVDVSAKKAHFANAGHPKPMLIRSGGEVELLNNQDQKSNPALGLFDGFRYSSSTVEIHPRDRLVLFTDGVYDVECNGELLSPEWLRCALQRRRELPLLTIFDQILEELRTFAKGDEFCDDMCLLGMEVKAH
jgi:sigma-B regulation protein RsbU (phosphoserine phosphatase)